MFSSFFHFGLYPTPLISYIAVPRFRDLIKVLMATGEQKKTW